MEIVRVCLVGAGSIGLVHLDGYLRAKDVVVEVVETDEKRRQAVQDKGITVYGSLDEALKVGHDLYDVCLPTHLHMETVTSILEGSEALVLCEKPIALSEQEATRLFEHPGARDRVFCALVERFNEPFAAIKQWTLGHTGPLTMEFTRRTKRPVNAPWFNRAELGGDILLDLGIHDIDLALWFAQAVPSKVSDHEFRDNDHESFCLHFPNGSEARIYLGWDLEDDHPIGIENNVSIQSGGSKISYSSDTELLESDETKTVTPRFPSAYYAEVDAMLRIVRAKEAKEAFPHGGEVLNGMKVFNMVADSRTDTDEMKALIKVADRKRNTV